MDWRVLLMVCLCAGAFGACAAHLAMRWFAVKRNWLTGYIELVRHVPFPALIHNGQIIHYANPACAELLRKPAAHLAGSSLLDIIPEQQQAMVQGSMARRMVEPFLQFAGEMVGHAGKVHSLQMTSLAINHGRQAARLLLLRRMDGAAEEHEQARQARQFSEHLLQSASVMIIGLDREGRIVIFNQAAERITGYTRAELSGGDWFETLVPRNRYPSVWARFEEFREHPHDESWVWENPILTRDSQERIILWQNTNLSGIHPAVFTLSFGVDVTELRQAQAHSQQAQADLAALFDSAHTAIFILKDRMIERANTAACHLFGFEQHELSDVSTETLHVSHTLYARLGQMAYPALKHDGNWRGEWPFRHRDGRQVWMDVTMSNLPDGRVLAIMTDLTTRREAEQQLRRLATAVESSIEGKVITDTSGTIQYVNPAFERTFHVLREDAIGKPIGSVITPANPEDPKYSEMWRTLGQGLPWTGQFANRAPDGGVFFVESSIAPVRDHAGRVVAYVGSENDVTEKVRLQQQYRQAQKLEAIGTLAGGIAHDFNNILFAIQGYTEMALDELSVDSRAYRNLQEALHASRRAASLVKQILTFSRQHEQAVTPVRVDLIAKEVSKFMRASLPANIEIRASISQDPPTVLADATQLHQVLMNLCANAGHAMQESGGTLEIQVVEVKLAEGSHARPAGLKHGSYLRMSVIDTGVGIPPEIRERIFEPFFTTKEVGEGTGLGLSVVHGIVASTGGAVEVESELGRGSAFHVYLPCTSQPVEEQPGEEAALPGGHGRVLIVDDERRIALMIKQQLEQLGYEASAVYQPDRALAELAAAPGKYGVVISDFSMPGMSGLDMLRQAKAAGLASRVVLVSGHPHDLSEAEREHLGIEAILLKPHSMHDLALAVHKAFHSLAAATADGTEASAQAAAPL